jgi:hypothetical protein
MHVAVKLWWFKGKQGRGSLRASCGVKRWRGVGGVVDKKKDVYGQV